MDERSQEKRTQETKQWARESSLDKEGKVEKMRQRTKQGQKNLMMTQEITLKKLKK